jgi:hypothetical protein
MMVATTPEPRIPRPHPFPYLWNKINALADRCPTNQVGSGVG